MHLKLVEMTGFKSFANKTQIELDDGFTAIVGPNGSGKSNITEAIKWVLGEQSAKSLRGHKMDDIIFAGAKDKKPSQYAEVTLVFDNTDRVLDIDMDEVSVSRRFTRAGESSYLINRHNCRLKDVTELMMDTGVGRESFSIISQGKVESIFTQKAEDRRGIFEEAAGVMKYKNRKKEAERKLKRSEENLYRIYDILSEVEGRLEPLASQCQAAVKYQDKKTELSDIEIALTAVQIETISEQWQIAKQDLASYNDDITLKKGKLTEIQALLTTYRQQETQTEEALNDLQEKYVDIVQDAEKVQTKIQVHNQQLAFNKRDRDGQKQALADLAESIELSEENIAYMGNQVADMAKDYQAKEQAFQAVKTELKTLGSDNHDLLENTRNQYIEGLQEQSHLRNQIIQAEKELEVSSQQEARQKRQLAELEAQLAIAETAKAELEASLKAKKNKIASLLADYQAHATRLKQMVVDGKQGKIQLNQLSQDNMRLEARKNSLEDLEREHAGFYQGVKVALNMQSEIAGIHGAVSQLMTVRAEYTTAVEIALGGGMQNIVTENGQVAGQVISELKRRRAGRATFLPLDIIKGRSLNDQILQTAQATVGFIGVLETLVNFDPKYQAIMANLMGNILVVDNLTNGRKLASSIQYKHRIVSLEGDIINAGGSMTGGANKRQSNGLLSRKADIEGLTAEIAITQAKQEKLESQLNQSDKDLENAQAQLAALKSAGDEARFDERTLEREQEQAIKQCNNLQGRIDVQVYEQETAVEDSVALQQTYMSNQQVFKEVSDKVIQWKQTLDNLNLSASEKESRRVEVQNKYQTLATEHAVLKERKIQLADKYQSEKKALVANESNYTALTEQLDQADSHLDHQTESSADLEKRYQELLIQQKNLNQEIKERRQERKTVHEKRQTSDVEMTALNEQLQVLMQKQAKVEATASRYEVAIDNHLLQLSEEYGLTYERARQESELNMSIEMASLRVRQLKKEIDQLGPVNLNAIAEYEEVHERYVFMAKQRDDVLQAKDILYNTIAEMDQEVTQRFHETFEAIRDQFEVIFPKLFGGGKASLELTDPNDLLATGIEISAQPPGKRLQLLSLLSGGEKALTAIALLFAILQVKTVPFSILDEVEAALDETNVSRFGRFLREFMTKTQFIVITHRKGTMEEAHLLYGVTMQESGVSKLASVRLEDFDTAGE